MGMELPFTEQADFKKLAQVPPGWWVKISPEAPFTMVVGRPFFAAIEDGTTGLVLFLGAIIAPQ